MPEVYDVNPEFASKIRQNIFLVILVCIAIIFTGRLAYLQIISGNVLRLKSEAQAIKENVVEPFRGNIFDRNNKLLVHNEPSFTVTLTPHLFKEEALPLLYSILDLDTKFINKLLNSNYRDIIFSPIKIYRDISYEKLVEIEENSELLPGIDVINESKRLYMLGDSCKMTHVLGFTREINEKQLKKMEFFKSGDIIGQSGLENSYNSELFGSKGVKFIAVNRQGEVIESFDKGRIDLPSRNGFDLYLTIDSRLQTISENLLKGKKGTVIVMDPRNGEILALASSPDFDLRSFTGKISQEFSDYLYNNKSYPMLNRAIQSKFPPGSTIKMLMAIAGLQEGIINSNSMIHSDGFFQLGNRKAGCHAPPGDYNVENSIRVSCNVFYYKLSLMIGFDNIIKYAKMFGFGAPTGIDIPGERSGILPTREWLNKNKKLNSIPKGMIINYGIGQGELTVTPLQIAAYTSTIANEGTYYQPHIVRDMYNNITFKKERIDLNQRELPIRKDIFRTVKKGMYGAVNLPGGTAQNVRLPGIFICGKTGTAQNPPNRSHSWFTSFAPYDKPEIVVTVMVQNGGYGSESAAPIAREIYKAYFFPDSYRYPWELFQQVSDSTHAVVIPD